MAEVTTQTVQPSYHVGIVTTTPANLQHSMNKIEIALIMVHYSLESIHFLGGTDVYFQAQILIRSFVPEASLECLPSLGMNVLL